MTKPITEVLSVERVREAYRVTGLKPATDLWAEPRWPLGSAVETWCACPASAVAVMGGVRPQDIFDADQGHDVAEQCRLVAEALDLDPKELLDFTNGVDCTTARMNEAIGHGKAVREALGLGEAGTK